MTRLRDWWDRIRSDGCGASEGELPEDVVETPPSGPDCVSDKDIQLGLWRLHVNTGHGSKEEMLRSLRLGKARSRAIKL